jgi:hypothetical protein
MTVTDISTYEVIEPQDQRYDAARAVWNGAIDHRPAPIARPRTDAEVTDALMRARDDGAEIAVRGGGHSMIFSGCRLTVPVCPAPSIRRSAHYCASAGISV